MKKTISIKTLGCKLNQYESAQIVHQFKENNWEVKKFGETVDLVIINTCTVTDRSDKKCRNYIRQGAKFSSKLAVIVTGCMVDRDKNSVSQMDEVLAVFSNKDKAKLYRDILTIPEYSSFKLKNKNYSHESQIMPHERTRGYLKIQDGCDGECSYCIVPDVRGKPKSRSFNDVIEHAHNLIKNNCAEIVLTGVTIGKYYDNGIDLAGLVSKIIEIPGKFRIRITSIEPKHVTNELAKLINSPKVCNHIHLPLQSGSNKILKDMNRPYTREEYLDVVKLIRQYAKDVSIGTDIIIGYPGENDQDFEDSINMIETVGFAYVHQFTFSPRSGTGASFRSDICKVEDIKNRSKKMRQISGYYQNKYQDKFLNRNLESIIEYNKKNNSYSATTDNYIKINILNKNIEKGCTGVLVPVKLVSNDKQYYGEIAGLD